MCLWGVYVEGDITDICENYKKQCENNWDGLQKSSTNQRGHEH